MKLRSLRVALLCLSAATLLQGQPAAPRVWPALSAVEKLYESKNYSGLRAATYGLPLDPAQPDLVRAKLLFFRGDGLFREIYQSRTRQSLDAETPIEPGRTSFELRFDQTTARLVARAVADLTLASELNQLHNGITAPGHDAKLAGEIPLALGLAGMEQAMFVTQAPKDFYQASEALREARSNVGTYGGSFAFDAAAPAPLRAGTQALTAELVALMGQGRDSDALRLFADWRKTEDGTSRPLLAPGAMASAYDLVGEYERTRALVLSMAVRQVRLDGGKFDAARHATARALLQTHLNNLNFALQQKPESGIASLRGVRLSGALVLRGNLTATERAYVLGVPQLTEAMWARRPAQVGRLRAMRLQLESADIAEQTAGRAALAAALKLTPDDDMARALYGRALLLAGDLEAAVKELSGVIERDTVFAGVVGALTDRSAAFTKQGRAAEAAADARTAVQFENLLGRLAAP